MSHTLGFLFSLREKGNLIIHSSMAGTRQHYAEWDSRSTEKQIKPILSCICGNHYQPCNTKNGGVNIWDRER